MRRLHGYALAAVVLAVVLALWMRYNDGGSTEAKISSKIDKWSVKKLKRTLAEHGAVATCPQRPSPARSVMVLPHPRRSDVLLRRGRNGRVPGVQHGDVTERRELVELAAAALATEWLAERSLVVRLAPRVCGFLLENGPMARLATMLGEPNAILINASLAAR